MSYDHRFIRRAATLVPLKRGGKWKNDFPHIAPPQGTLGVGPSMMQFEVPNDLPKVARMSEDQSPIGFKEWTYVCEALGQGVQTVILRKGGIHEGRGGFHFLHDAFWLFPTGFHNQGDLLNWTPPNAEEVAVPQEEVRERVDVRYFARLHQLWKLTDWDRVSALAPLHVWKDEVVRDRFAWNEDSSLHVALVRVYRLPSVWSFPYQRGYGGCRSWVKLPAEGAALEATISPVLPDQAWEETASRVRAHLGPS